MDKILRASLAKSVILTLICVGASIALDHISLPYVGSGLSPFMSETLAPRVGVIGIWPLISGFFLVEMVALFLPPFHRWRHQAEAGRNRLNLASIFVSLVIAVWTSYKYVVAFSSPSPLVGVWFLVLLLVAAFIFRIGLMAMISRLGVGNGFCVLLLGDALGGFGADLKRHVPHLRSKLMEFPQFEDRLLQTVFLILSVGVVGFVLYRIFRGESLKVKSQADTSLRVETPLLPQSLFLLDLAGTVAGAPLMLTAMGISFGALSGFFSQQGGRGYSPWVMQWTHAALLILASYVGYRLFSTGKAINRDLQGQALVDEVAADRTNLRRSLLQGCLLALLLFDLNNPFIKFDFQLGYVLTMVALIGCIAILLDLRASLRFISQHGLGQKVVDFDNCHLAALAKALLQQNKIPCRLDGYLYRRLYFLTQPVAKIRLFVREQDVARTGELLDLKSVSIL